MNPIINNPSYKELDIKFIFDRQPTMHYKYKNYPLTKQCQGYQHAKISSNNTAQCTVEVIDSKLVQVLLDLSLIIFCLAEYIISVKIQGRLSFNTKVSIHLLIFLSLFCTYICILVNMIHNLIGRYKVFLFIELFWTNLFFITVFYYFGDNVLRGTAVRIGFHVFYGAMCVFYVVIFVLRVVYEAHVWCPSTISVIIAILYMVVDTITLLVSLMIFVLYYQKNREQQKMQNFYLQQLLPISPSSSVAAPLLAQSSSYQLGSQNANNPNISSPFIRMYVLIFTYIFCGLVNLVETVIIYVGFSETCKFSTDVNTDVFIKFWFYLFDYYLGCLITLVVLRMIRIADMPIPSPSSSSNNVRPTSFTNQALESNKLQLMANKSMSSRQSNIT